MRKKVLVADDSEITRKFLEIFLSHWGYHVKEAEDGEKAMEELAKDNFDLLICDIMMPKKDGWQVLEEVKSNAKTKQIPVIILTAKDGDPDLFKAYSLGASYYMTKPFSYPKAQLLHAIQSLFGDIPDRGRPFAR